MKTALNTPPDSNLEEPTVNLEHEAPASAASFLDGVFGQVAAKVVSKHDDDPRGKTQERIRKLAPAIIAKYGAKFICASTLQEELAQEDGVRLNANFLGDCLGGHGLRLPRIVKRSKTRYALHMVDCTSEQKAAVQAQLNALSPEHRTALIVA